MITDVYLGLGSNLGDRPHNIAVAADLLGKVSTSVTVSSLYETRPEGFMGQPPFVNAACQIWTRLSPFGLLKKLKEIQHSVGGHRPFANAPRTLDIDILIYGRSILESPGLSIPHPRMAGREFVLAPLAEIAPDLRHPILKETIRTLLLRLRQSDGAGAVALLPRPGPGRRGRSLGLQRGWQ